MYSETESAALVSSRSASGRTQPKRFESVRPPDADPHPDRRGVHGRPRPERSGVLASDATE